MAATHRISLRRARQIAVRSQLLDAERPTALMAMMERLTFLQIDPTAAIAPNADLVAWTRLGQAYRPEHLVTALEQRQVFELDALIRAMADLRLFAAEMAQPPQHERARQWLVANEPFRRDVLARLRESGPLLSREIPDTCVVPWASSGWTGNRNVTQMLEMLTMTGQVAIAGRHGRQRLWDLAERVYPADVDPVPIAQAKQERDGRRLRALGIARERGPEVPMEPAVVGTAGEPAVVDGVPGQWRVHPEALDEPFEGRTALLSPFDRLVHDRRRAQDLFGFDYVLEMYKPAAQRRWGYFALPLLHGDQLVGKLDAKADRKRGVLEVFAVHPDQRLTTAITAAIDAEIDALAGWLGLEVSRLDRRN